MHLAKKHLESLIWNANDYSCHCSIRSTYAFGKKHLESLIWDANDYSCHFSIRSTYAFGKKTF